MSNSSEDRDPVEALAEEFVDRYRRGEKPVLQEYVDRYPHLADDIRDLFPALLKMEKVRPQTGDVTGEFTDRINPAEKKLERLGDYRVLREVGRGGMGIVYEAEQESLGRHVALKVLPHHALLDSKHLQRFHREAKAAARLHHTNIVPVYGVGADDGLHYYVMQFIHGMGLDEVLADLKRLRQAKCKADRTLANEKASTAAGVAAALLTGEFTPQSQRGLRSPETVSASDQSRIGMERRLSSMESTSIASDSSVHLPGQTGTSTLTESGRPYWQSVARIGVQIAEALAYAHSQGTLHRDIKPSNLLLDNQGTVWVTDFGLAKASDSADLTHTGDILGTVRYMAPERFKGLSDARSDIYSLGLTLYEMLALRPAFAESDRNRLIRQVTHEEPPRPRKLDSDVPRDLETIVLKAISKEPAHRYGAAGELAADLQRYLEDKPIRARRVSPRERLWRWCRRNPGLASTIGVAATLLLAVTLVSTWFAFAKADFAARQSSLNEELAQEQKQTLAEKERAEGASRDLAVSLEKSQRLSALMAIEKARTFTELHQTGPAMVWLARALKLAPADALDLQQASQGALSSLRPEVPILKAVIEHHTPIFEVALGPDGKTMMTGGGDYLSKKGDVQLWDLATGKPLAAPLKHQSFVISVAFSPDGKKVLTASLDRTARIWDVATGQPIGRPLKLTGPGYIYTGAFSPDGKWIFTGGTEQGQLWDAATAEPAGSPWASAGLIYDVAFSPDGKTIVTGSGNPSDQTGQIRFWHIDPLEPVDPPITQPSPVTSVAFSPDGSQVLYGSADGKAQLLDSASRKSRGPIFRHLGPILHVSFSPDGQWVVTAGSGFLRLWDIEFGQAVGDPLPQNSLSRGGGFCPDGRTLVVPRTERTVGIWELPLGRLKGPLLPHPAPITALSFSPDGKKVLTGCGQESRGESQLWEVATGEPLGPPSKMAGPVTRVALSPDGRTMVATRTAISGQLLGHALPIQSDSLAFSADGKTVVTGVASQGGQNQSAALRDIFSGKYLGPPLVVTGALWALDLDAKGETIVTGSGDISRGELQFWNARTGRKIGSPLTYASRVLVARFSPDGLHVVTGHYDSQALLWNTRQGKRHGPALVHQGPVRAAAFSPDAQFLVTGSVDRTARIWHVKTGQPLGLPLRHPGTVTAVAFSPDGASIMTGCTDGLVRFWQGPATSRDQEPVRTIPVVTGLTLSDEGELGHLEGSGWQGLRKTSEVSEPSEVQTHAATTALPWHLQQALQAIEAHAWKTAQWHLDREFQANPDEWLAPVLQFRVTVEQTDADADRRKAGPGLAKAAADAESALKSASAKMALPWFRKFSAEAARKEQWTKALWYLDRIVAAGLDDGATQVDRAQIFAKLRKWDEAAQAYGKAIAAKTNDPLLRLERGRIYARLEKWDQVAADFTKAIALLPEARSVNDRRSEICAELAQWDQAMTKAVQLMPKGSDLCIAAGRYHARLSQWDQAAADFARADWSRPLGDDTFEYACLFLIRGDVEGYRKFFEGLISRIGPRKDPFAAFVLARIAAMAPPGVLDPARALEWGKLAVESDPKVPWYLHALALAHYRAGQLDLALQRFQESLDGYWNFPELNYLGRALAEHHRGHAAAARENLDQGLAWLQKYTPMKPDQPTELFATDWLEAQLLRREAEALMKPGKVGSP